MSGSHNVAPNELIFTLLVFCHVLFLFYSYMYFFFRYFFLLADKNSRESGPVGGKGRRCDYYSHSFKVQGVFHRKHWRKLTPNLIRRYKSSEIKSWRGSQSRRCMELLAADFYALPSWSSSAKIKSSLCFSVTDCHWNVWKRIRK